MKRKVLIIIYIILIFLMLKICYNTMVNTILLVEYAYGKYDDNIAESLTHINFLQGYVAHYNYGNILYQNGEYEEAIEEYKEALKGYVPKYKKCSIRINYALAICKTVQVDESNKESIQKAISKYESAIKVLTEEGCANKNNNNGHSQEAETLKKDIQKEIDRLKNLKQQAQENSDDKEDKEDKEKNEKNEQQVKNIEEKVQKLKEEATKVQRQTESMYEGYNKEYTSYEPNNKNW